DHMDERTDIYGLAGILYEILTGQPPFMGSTTLEVLEKAVRGNPPPPRDFWLEVPRDLEAACLKALARDPAGRHARADDLAQEVERWQDVQRRRAEDALRRQTEILSSILNSMSEGVMVADEAGNLLLTNPAVERLISRPEEATLAATRTANEFYRPDRVTPFKAEDMPSSRAIRGEEVNDEEMFIRPVTGKEGIWASASGRPLRDQAGALTVGVVVFRDITE